MTRVALSKKATRKRKDPERSANARRDAKQVDRHKQTKDPGPFFKRDQKRNEEKKEEGPSPVQTSNGQSGSDLP